MKLLLSILMLGIAVSLQAQTPFSEISVQDFEKIQAANKQLVILDVRTPEEVAQGKIAGAVVVDYMKTSFGRDVQKLDKTKPIVVYCATGYRSGEALEEMRKLGFKTVYHLRGGVVAWRRAGKTLVK